MQEEHLKTMERLRKGCEAGMKMKDAVMELMANTSLYSGGSTVTISEQAARGVLRYITHLEKKQQKQTEPKEQETVKPTVSGVKDHDGHGSWWYQCGKCKTPIDYKDKFCRFCGSAVKWE